MLLGGSYIGRCARNIELNVVTSGMSIQEIEEVKLLWDFTIQTDREIQHRRPDIVIQKKEGKGNNHCGHSCSWR